MSRRTVLWKAERHKKHICERMLMPAAVWSLPMAVSPRPIYGRSGAAGKDRSRTQLAVVPSSPYCGKTPCERRKLQAGWVYRPDTPRHKSRKHFSRTYP